MIHPGDPTVVDNREIVTVSMHWKSGGCWHSKCCDENNFRGKDLCRYLFGVNEIQTNPTFTR